MKGIKEKLINSSSTELQIISEMNSSPVWIRSLGCIFHCTLFFKTNRPHRPRTENWVVWALSRQNDWSTFPGEVYAGSGWITESSSRKTVWKTSQKFGRIRSTSWCGPVVVVQCTSLSSGYRKAGSERDVYDRKTDPRTNKDFTDCVLTGDGLSPLRW